MSDKFPSKTMVILSGENRVTAAAETFLKNRGWQIHSTSDIKEALSYAAENTTSYLLISVDHPSSKITMVPKLFQQTLQITVIAFIEKNLPESEAKLTQFHANYRVSNPTGPAIERCIHKHHRELEQKDKETVVRSSIDSVKQEDQIRIKSGGSLEADIYRSTNQTAKVNVNIQKGHRGEMLSNPEQSKNLKSGAVIQSNNTGNIKTRNFNNPAANADARSDRLKSDDETSLLSTAVKKSLAEAKLVVGSSAEEAVRSSLDDPNAVCMVVDSPRLSGYLVATQVGNTVPSPQFNTIFQEKVVQFLAEKGEQLAEKSGYDVRLKEVHFDSWAKQAAHFLECSAYNGKDISIAFFPRKDVKIKLENSEVPEMAKVKIDELLGDRIIRFDLFIFLKENNKLILVTAKGTIFRQTQRTRFIDQGQTHLHVRKNELNLVAQYFAEAYLNDLVDTFQNQIKSSQAG
ncbi:MAG: hypothetical protein H7256_03280 [Bdellovibrio sp.]|nr:hypothetical protein [Bdellovibrio sp.]